MREAGDGDRLAEAHFDPARPDLEAAARQDLSRADDRHRHDVDVTRAGVEDGSEAAALEAAELARRRPRALGEGDQAAARGEQRARPVDAGDRFAAGGAIDEDHAHGGDVPAEERHPRELLLGEEVQRRRHRGEEHRDVEPGLMVGGEKVGAPEVEPLAPDDAQARQPDGDHAGRPDVARQPERRLAPPADRRHDQGDADPEGRPEPGRHELQRVHRQPEEVCEALHALSFQIEMRFMR